MIEKIPRRDCRERDLSNFGFVFWFRRLRSDASSPTLPLQDFNMDEDDQFRQLKETLLSDPDNSSHRLNLGIFLWQNSNDSKQLKEKAVEHFVISAKLNPSNALAFRYLGHYYSGVSIDLQRALKCYQRAVALNPDDFEAGERLCDLLDEGGKESLEVAVCREAKEKSPRAFWAFRRLGYMLIYQKKWSEAVQSLQHAIRGYPTCADLWEALGLAYQRLGMFTAAIKSYARAIDLEDTKVFALVESGNILLILGSFKKGVEHFRHALLKAPHNVAAQYGLASGLLGLSKECMSFGAFGWGASLLEEASEIARTSSSLAGNNSSIWKLHGDIQLAYSKCFPWTEECLNIKSDEKCFRTSILMWKRKCLLAAISASRSYQRVLHLTPWQPNIYPDIAISLDLISSIGESNISDMNAWDVPEKMSLGGLMLEGSNSEFWVVLGCLSNHNALKQYALIKGLHLDVSLAEAWAYLGKFYRKEGEKLLARQAFDHARSIDPSLALPWASMSVDTHAGDCTPDDAYESCLRAVQILPLPEFQVGLGKLAFLSGQLRSPHVFGSLRQAVQRAPHLPESHNLNGLVYEAQANYHSAIAAYRQARYAISCFAETQQTSFVVDVSVNLARSLCKAGYALDAVHECEGLNKEGFLDEKGLQVYAVALWKLGKTDQALSAARNLGKSVSKKNHESAVSAIGLICKLLYQISGQESAAATILKVPRDLLQSSKLSSIHSVLIALDGSGRSLPSTLDFLSSHEEIVGLHFLIAIVKLVIHGSNQSLGIQSGVNYLQKVLHTYPSSTLIRNQLSSFLLWSKEWKASHIGTRCVVMEPAGSSFAKGPKSAYEIIGSAAVSCYTSCTSKMVSCFPTCTSQWLHRTGAVQQLQRWLHQEPWNHRAQYLLVLNFLQKTQEEKFPPHLCVVLQRLVFAALANEVYSRKDRTCQYQKSQLLLCASEICLQNGDYHGSISHAIKASQLPSPCSNLFFVHLQLCRVYAVQEDFSKLKDEYMKCLQLGTDYPIGWISLKYFETRYRQQVQLHAIDLNFEKCLKEKGPAQNMWMAIFDLLLAQSFLWDQDFLRAKQALEHAFSLGVAESCLFLTHGAICMELARQMSGSEFLYLAVSSLIKAQESSLIPLPIVSTLLAQAEASLGARTKWERNLRLEWFSWPEEMRPAELYFQMHLLARQSRDPYNVESSQSPQRWILRAIHSNPSCIRYWKVLQKGKE